MVRKVLFVCTANLQRSPTAEHLFQGWKSVWQAKSAGTDPDPGKNPLTQELVDWAEVIIVMEPHHSQHIRAHYRCSPDKVRVLNLQDIYYRNDPKLKRELMKKVPTILEKN